MREPFSRIMFAGGVYLASTVALAVTHARLGTSLFLACSAVASAAYLAVLALVWRAPHPARRSMFFLALAFAVAFRASLAIEPVNAGNDMFRYIWDGRVQRLGYNPYAVLPSDPALQTTHTDDSTRLMPSRNRRTPYPPAAQLFFRLVVTLHDSARTMKVALIACDLLVILVVWRWLLVAGRSEWLTLAYAWNPLVVLEVAYSGHLDALSALWISACAYLLVRRHTALAATAFALAVGTKLLPIVLAPILWRRMSVRDAAVGGSVIVLLYLPFSMGANPLTAVDNMVEHIRFNGPLFQAIADLSSPKVAGAFAVAIGLLAAMWCRRKLPAGHPAAWAWPMALALACAPVVYPWYLLSVTPFLLVPATLPLIAWTLSVPAVYVVWERALAGGQWVVPGRVLMLQCGVVLAAVMAAASPRLRRPRNPRLPSRT